MKPAHAHDCENCVLVGQLSAWILGDPTKSITWDFYLCELPDPPERTLLARYGPGKAIFSTQDPLARLASDTTRWPLNVGAQLVLARRKSTP